MSEKQSTLSLVIAAVIALILGLGLGLYSDFDKPETNQAPEISGVILPVAKKLADFSLQDHQGQIYSKQNLSGQWSVLFLGYTQCPDVCPATLTMVKQAMSIIEKENQALLPQVVFVSVDPERDSLEKLAEYVAYFNPVFKAVTGSDAELKKLALGLSVYYKKVPGMSGEEQGDDYLMDHSAALMMVNPDGDLQAFITGPHVAEKIAASIIKVQKYYNNK